MQLQDQYDWVVLGDHPGALLSAAIASQLGLSVLVLPLAPSLLCTVSSEGQVLDPEPNYVLGLGKNGSSSGLLAECLSQLGASSFTPKLIRSGSEIVPQALTPGARFSLAVEEEPLFRELEREFGSDFAKTSGLLAALNIAESRALAHWRGYPSALIERRFNRKSKKFFQPNAESEPEFGLRLLRQSLRGMREEGTRSARNPSRYWLKSKARLGDVSRKISNFGSSAKRAPVSDLRESFEESVRSLWFGLAGTEQENPQVLDWLHIVALARTAGSFRGGMSAFRRFLAGLAQRLGAQIPSGLECRRIFIEDGRLIGIQLSDRGKMLITKAGILGCSTAQATETLSFSGRKGARVLRPSPPPLGWRFTLALSVYREAIPVGMSERAVWKEHGSPPLEIEVVDPAVYEQSGGDLKYIFLRTWLPFTQQSLEVSYQRLVASRMFRQLTELFPFLEFHVRRVYPDFRVPETVMGKDEFSEVYGFVSTDFIPDNLRVYSNTSSGCFSGIQGLYIANGESFPIMGSFGATVAAIEAVSHFSTRLGPQSSEKLSGFWSFLS